MFNTILTYSLKKSNESHFLRGKFVLFKKFSYISGVPMRELEQVTLTTLIHFEI